MIAGQGFIVAGALAEQTQLCAQLVSSVLVEHQSPCLVLQEHLALKQATYIKTTAPPVPVDTTVQVGNMAFSRVILSKKSKSILLHSTIIHLPYIY